MEYILRLFPKSVGGKELKDGFHVIMLAFLGGKGAFGMRLVECCQCFGNIPVLCCWLNDIIGVVWVEFCL